jgi:flagellar hook-associated protein 1 FlgK
LQNKLHGLNITSPSAGRLQVLDNGLPGNRDITGLTSRGTAAGMQTGELAMALFVDQGGAPFTGNLDTDPPQVIGFAARISINPAVLTDNRLLVQFDVDHTLGDASRPDYVLKQLNSMNFVSGTTPAANVNRHPLTGTIEQLIGQVLNYQGTTIGAALSQRDDRMLTLDTITSQMETEYGVDMDQEMARLTELQSAYAANARIVAVVKELLDTLFAST